MVTAEDVIRIYSLLSKNGIRIWLTGGWGIDALLGEQTRPHKDLDAILLLDDMLQMYAILSQDGFSLKEIWSENTWVVDGNGSRTATAFVLHDEAGCEFDAHAIRLDEQGSGIPAWQAAEGFIFAKEDLAAQGMVAGYPIRCITPNMQVLCHTGYPLLNEQLRDLARLHEKFGVDQHDASFG